MASEKLEVMIMLSAFLSGAIVSVANNPMPGLAVLMGVLITWGGVKRVPKLKRIRIEK